MLDQLTTLARTLAQNKNKQVRFDDNVKPPRVETTSPTPGNRTSATTTSNKATPNRTTTTAVVDKRFESSNSGRTKRNQHTVQIRQRLHRLAKNRLPISAQILLMVNSTEDDGDTTRDNIELANNIFDPDTGQSLTYRKLIKHPKYKDVWTKSAANEFQRLAQGLKDGCVKGTIIIKFICKDQVPIKRMKDVMYGSFRCDFKTNK